MNIKELLNWKFKTFKTPIYIAFLSFFTVYTSICLFYGYDGLDKFEAIKLLSTVAESAVCLYLFTARNRLSPVVQYGVLSSLMYIATFIGIITAYLTSSTESVLISVLFTLIIANNITLIFFPRVYSIVSGTVILATIISSGFAFNRHLSSGIYIMVVPITIAAVAFNCYFASVFRRIFNYQLKLKALANTDSLTGVYNRKFLSGNIISDNLMKFKGSVIMLDIDFFKKINDDYGHLAGDVILSAFASTIKSSIRKEDCIIRSGGEEFLVICKDLDFEGAKMLAERIRAAVDNSNGSPHFTVSVGVTNFFDQEKFEDVYKRVDDLLYKSKNTGRNKVSSLCFQK